MSLLSVLPLPYLSLFSVLNKARCCLGVIFTGRESSFHVMSAARSPERAGGRVIYDPIYPRGNPHDSTSILGSLLAQLHFMSLPGNLIFPLLAHRVGPAWHLMPKCPPPPAQHH